MSALALGVWVTLAASSAVYAADGYSTAAPKAKPAPTIRAKCLCPAPVEGAIVRLEGLVVDAELTLGPDGRTANDRQATIFEIWRSDGAEVSGRTKVWHSADTEACGVIFDYGRKYQLAARKNEAGELETDACVMRAISKDG